MPHGRLSEAQEEAIQPYVFGKAVHDLGCGNLDLSRWLVQAGAEKVVAIDRYQPVTLRKPAKIEVIVGYFDNYLESVDTAFVSWPINWIDIGLLRMVKEAKTVIYLGSNLDGNACGFREMFQHLLGREVLAHVPNRQNTLIIYGSHTGEREPVPEEFAALNQERMYSFREVYPPPSP